MSPRDSGSNPTPRNRPRKKKTDGTDGAIAPTAPATAFSKGWGSGPPAAPKKAHQAAATNPTVPLASGRKRGVNRTPSGTAKTTLRKTKRPQTKPRGRQERGRGRPIRGGRQQREFPPKRLLIFTAFSRTVFSRNNPRLAFPGRGGNRKHFSMCSPASPALREITPAAFPGGKLPTHNGTEETEVVRGPF
ncbi:hypothetical protein LSM04_009298 [Trypanosoma melophagium]|uniref:uncharacterized protein n=1 Tax=Trypanosoma melophagium TaxID=715481 RepID=UPI00351A94FE|nr:hypothetical protein LSM04_009298 [Trypanosoma melophagium]